MNVKYMASATFLNGLVVQRLGTLDDHADRVNWSLQGSGDLVVFSLQSSDGEGAIVAGSVAVDESDASSNDPADFS